MDVLTPSKIRALIRLLDEDGENRALVQEHLLNAGIAAIPYLKEAIHGPSAIIRKRASILLEELHFDQLQADFRRYAALADREMDLEKGAFLVARYGFPDLIDSDYSEELDRIAASVDSLLEDDMVMHDVIVAFNHVLFREEGFRPENRRFYDPENSFLNKVLERRTGIPITLSVVFLLIASRLNVAISGMSMPGHFLVRYDSPVDTLFIDPFNYGAILSYEDCENLLMSMGHQPKAHYFAPSTTREIIGRMLNNLVEAFIRESQFGKADEVYLLAQTVTGGV